VQISLEFELLLAPLRNAELLSANQAVAEIVIKIYTRRLDKGRGRTGQHDS
jgi:hypothetical protein